MPTSDYETTAESIAAGFALLLFIVVKHLLLGAMLATGAGLAFPFDFSWRAVVGLAIILLSLSIWIGTRDAS